MNTLPRLLLCALLLSPLLSRAAEPANTSCEALKAENAALKAKVLELQAQLAPRVATPADATPPPAPSTPAMPGLAPKPGKKQVVVEEEPYSRSGCRSGLFTSLPHAPWMEVDRWLDLKKGMPAAAVEALLGPEHYDTVSGTLVKWDYGKCGSYSRAQLLFDNGQLVDWRPPSQ